MMSASDVHEDSPVTSIHEQSEDCSFNSAPLVEANSDSRSSNNQASAQAHRQLESIPSRTESNADEQPILLNGSHSNEIAIANDATQLLLARLGILRRRFLISGN